MKFPQHIILVVYVDEWNSSLLINYCNVKLMSLESPHEIENAIYTCQNWVLASTAH